MATLVLTAVGTAIGGPIGGALGSLVGQAVDTQLFGPGPRKGPRLDDLRLQTSSYGTQIPRLYGRMRVAGTVIWATDLKESEEIEGGGKGSPETVAYSYSCSFAVALSSRAIQSIGRIWADGKLIRGAGGDLKVKGRLRTLKGSEGQKADPIFTAVEGPSNSPGYRGLALAVFEDLALGEFGNRLPMLTFEVVADDASVPLSALLEDATSGNIRRGASEDDTGIGGYAVFGSDQRAAVEQLCELGSLVVRSEGPTLTTQTGVASALVATEEVSWGADRKSYPARGEWTQDAAGTQPAALAVRYHDPARDYQAGSMQATMPGGRGEKTLDSAATLTAADAKRWAEQALARRWAGRDRLTLRLPPSWLDLVPGDFLEFVWRTGRWRVEEVRIEAFAVVAECRRMTGPGAVVPADAGRSNSEPDVPIGESVVALFDLPDLGEGASGALRLHAAVSASGGFKSVPLLSMVGGQQGAAALASRRARLGRSVTLLQPGPTTFIDRVSTVDVVLVDPTQVLLNADASALDSGANLCMLGEELIQFGRALDLGGGRFRLSHLLRGRRGSEWAAAEHAVDERFVMIDRSALVPLSFDPSLFDQTVQVTAHGVADDDGAPPTAECRLVGSAGRPLSPCQLRLDADVVKWIRRSRDHWIWADGILDPIAPVAFEVSIAGGQGHISRIVGEEEMPLSAADLTELGARPFRLSVVERSGSRRSRPTEGSL